MSNLLPELAGCVVRPITLADAEAWAAYVCRPEVTRFTSSTAQTVADVRPVIERTLSGQADAPLRFVLLSAASGELLATVGFHSISTLFGSAEVAYDVHPAHWGRGLATAACRAACRWGFAQRGWSRIQATTVLPHLASQRVLERSGFQREGLLRHFRQVRGVPTDYWMYSLLPGELREAD